MESRKIGQFIAALRKERGFTQQELADRLGVTNKAVSKWERGDGLPDVSLMTGLADALGITVDELLRGERRPPVPEEAPASDGEAPPVPLAHLPRRPDGNMPHFGAGEGPADEPTRIIEYPVQSSGTGMPGEEEGEPDGGGEEPFYRRPWFLPAVIGTAAAVLLLLLVGIFWMGKRVAQTDGKAAESGASSTDPGYHTTAADSTAATSSATASTAATTSASHTTTTSTAATQSTTTPTVPTTPQPPANPALPGTGEVPQAKHAILFNATEGRILYGYGYEERCYPASLTKLLTAIIVLENADEDAVFTVGDEILLVREDSSIAYLEQGQRMKRDVLLHALLLDSGNDAAYVLAAGIGREKAGDPSLSAEEAVGAFCSLMNRKAAEIGAKSSHFVNPDGFHNPEHYTTPMDILTISRYAYSLPEIRSTVSESYIYDRFETGEEKTWWNTNLLVRYDDSHQYAGATGLKTGYTDEAGDCVVATAERNGVTLFAVVLDAPSDAARWEDAAAMLDAGFSLS